MHRAGNTRQEWLSRIVQTNYFDPRAYFEIGFCKLAQRPLVDLHPLGKDSDYVKCMHGTYILSRRGFGNGGPSRALDRHPVPKAQHDRHKTSRIPIARDKTPRT